MVALYLRKRFAIAWTNGDNAIRLVGHSGWDKNNFRRKGDSRPVVCRGEVLSVLSYTHIYSTVAYTDWYVLRGSHLLTQSLRDLNQRWIPQMTQLQAQCNTSLLYHYCMVLTTNHGRLIRGKAENRKLKTAGKLGLDVPDIGITNQLIFRVRRSRAHGLFDHFHG